MKNKEELEVSQELFYCNFKYPTFRICKFNQICKSTNDYSILLFFLFLGVVLWAHGNLRSRFLKSCFSQCHFITTRTKKINSLPGPLPVWNLHILLMSVWVLSGSSCFLSHPKHVPIRFTGVSTLSQCGWVWVSVNAACNGMVSCPGLGPTLCPELLGQTPATFHPKLE